MIRYRGGEKAGKGTYWNLESGERVDIATEGMLPGDSGRTFYRLPSTGILLMAPVLGLLYAVFLPFIGIAMLVKVGVKRVAAGRLEPAMGAASFGWRPGESYLAGRKKSGKKEEEEGPGGEDRN